MVEHSLNVNEDDIPAAVSDYMQALESAKFDQVVMPSDQPNQSGEFDLESQPNDKDGSMFASNGDFF